jgi:TP901 family phage tail tape measure protein
VDYGVRTVFTAKNNLSPEMNRMGRDVDRFGRRAKAEFKSLGQVIKGSFVGNVMANAVSSGFGMMRRGIEGVATDFIALDKGLNESAVKFGGIDYGSEKFKELSAVARQVGTTTKFSAIDAAGGLEALAAAGFAADNALRILPTVANFAAAAKMDLASATQVAGEALNSFGMNAKDAATQTSNLARISDVMAESDRMSNASMQGLAETVSYGASAFTNAGQSLETFGAVAASLADSAKHGSMAGTIMRGMMDSLTSRTPKAEKALRRLGLSIKGDVIDKSGNLLNVVDILKKMEEPLSKLGTAERAKAITDIFDVRAGAGVMSMINSGIDKTIEYQRRLEETSGTAERSGKQLTTSLGARIELLQNAFTEKGFQVFDQLLTGGTGKIDDMIAAVQRFDVKPIASGIKTIADAIGTIASHTGALKALGTTFLAYKGAVMVGGGLEWLRQFRGVVGGLGGGGAGGVLSSAGMSYGALGLNPARMTPMPNGKLLIAPGTGVPIIPLSETKAKITGSQIANGFVGIVQSAGIGIAIGTAISETLSNSAKDLEGDRNNLIRGFDALGMEVAGMSGMTPEQRAQLRNRIEGSTSGLENEWVGGTGNLTWSGMGKTLGALFTGSDTPEEILEKANNRKKKLLTAFDTNDRRIEAGYFDPAKLGGQTQDPSAWIRALDKRQQVDVKIELTGDGADKARVVSTKASGESAPKVSKNRTGKQ